LAAATAICEKVLAAMPAPGEDSLEIAAPWIAHVASRATELVAGFCGERLGGYAEDGEPGSSDLAIAQVYAASIAAPGAINVYLDFCRASATTVLKDHWPAVLALATALENARRRGNRPDLIRSRIPSCSGCGDGAPKKNGRSRHACTFQKEQG